MICDPAPQNHKHVARYRFFGSYLLSGFEVRDLFNGINSTHVVLNSELAQLGKQIK